MSDEEPEIEEVVDPVSDDEPEVDYYDDGEIFGTPSVKGSDHELEDGEIIETPTIPDSVEQTPKTPRKRKRKKKELDTPLKKLRAKIKKEDEKRHNARPKIQKVSITKIELSNDEITLNCRKYYSGHYKGGISFYPPNDDDDENKKEKSCRNGAEFASYMNQLVQKGQRKPLVEPVMEFFQLVFGHVSKNTFNNWFVDVRKHYRNLSDDEKKRLGDFVPPNIYKQGLGNNVHDYQDLFIEMTGSALQKKSSSIFMFNAFMRLLRV